MSSGPKPNRRRVISEETGEAVYPCLFEGCDKTFGTAGHVRRHEKSHIGNTPHACRYCNKAFVRSDVRAKHEISMHPDEHRDNMANEPNKRMKRESAGAVYPQERSVSPSASASARSVTTPFGQTWIRGSVDLSPLGGQTVGLAPPAGAHQTLFDPSTTATTAVLPPSELDLGVGSSSFLDPSTLGTGPSVTQTGLGGVAAGAGAGGMAGLDLGPMDQSFDGWQAFSHVFGWALDDNIDTDIGLQNSMFDYSDIGPISSTEHLSAAWLMSMTPRHTSPVDGGNGKEDERKRDPFGRNHDTPWVSHSPLGCHPHGVGLSPQPSLFKPKVPDRPLTLGGVKASPRPNRDRTGSMAISPPSRNAMLSLIYLAHQAHWLMPDVEDFPDQDTLSDFIDLYFEKFHPTFPVLHKPTILQQGDTPPVLLMAIAAVGATYADPEFKPLAVALSELVRRMVQWMRASDQRSKFDLNGMAAYMLQTLVGMACGSREMVLHGEISRASLCTTTRRLHLLRPGKTATEELFAKERNPSLEARYRAYVEDEGRRRMGWGAYVVDMQMTALLGIPALFAPSELGVELPGDDALWDAPTPEAWAKRYDSSGGTTPKPPFVNVLRAALRRQPALSPSTDFGRAILSYSLFRMEFDQYQHAQLLDAGEDAAGALGGALQSKPAQALLALVRNSASLSSPEPLQLASAAIYHHSRMVFARQGLFEHIRAASGKYEPDVSRSSAIEWIKDWVKDGRSARRVLWHAAVLNAVMTEFPKGGLPEPFWVFDCALVFWVVVKYGTDALGGSGIKSALFAANWFDVEPPAIWVEHGGQIFLPYLGSSSALNVGETLRFFMERLHKIPWGMAALFRQVLAKLLEAERD